MQKRPRKPRNLILTDTQVKNAKPVAGKQIKLADSGGLYLLIKPTGSKLWRWKYYMHGVERLISFGAYPGVGLAEARTLRDQARKQAKAGIDPVGARSRKQNMAAQRTFKAVADDYLAFQAAQTATTTADKQKWFLGMLKPLHRHDITTIETPDVVAAVKGIESSIQKRQRMAPTAGVETARRCAALTKRIFEYANNVGIIKDGRNPAAAVHKVLLPVDETHHPAITEPSGIGRLLYVIDGYEAKAPAVRYGLKIEPYIFLRPFEQRHLLWEWVDLRKNMIRVPVEFMKKVRNAPKSDHYIPLAPQVAALFAELKEITGDGRFVFPGVSRSRPMSDNALTSALRRLGYTGAEMTWHGFRSLASTTLNEMGFDADLIEVQLAHRPAGGKVRAIYNRASYLGKRRKMMNEYANHLDELREKYWLG